MLELNKSDAVEFIRLQGLVPELEKELAQWHDAALGEQKRADDEKEMRMSAQARVEELAWRVDVAEKSVKKTRARAAKDLRKAVKQARRSALEDVRKVLEYL